MHAGKVRGIVPFLAAVSLLGLTLSLIPIPATRGGPGVLFPRPAAAGPAAGRPNIIFILTDDQDTKSVEVMPKLKSQIIDQGTTFANFFVTYALCCPSRSSILRGQYPHNHQVLSNSPPLGGFQKFHSLGNENSTVGTWLQAAGYRTALMGKYLNGYPNGIEPTYVPPGWDEWDSPSGGNPYSNFNYKLNENGKIVSYGNRPEDYMTDVLAKKAADFIRRSNQAGKPFFIYLATYAPHQPATPAPRHANAFPNVTAPRPPSFNEADVSDKPEWVRERSQLADRAIEQINGLYRKRLQSLLAVDDLIGTLIDMLQATGELQRTYIFYTSDNGFHLGEHRLPVGKNTAYEEDIRVPLIVRGPGVSGGRTVQHLTLNIDFAPTFGELAAASVPAFVDGRSLVSLLSSNPPSLDRWRQAFLVEHYSDNPRRQDQAPRRSRGIPDFQALRARDYLYVEYATGERELYDLRKDPYELQSLHATADQAFLSQLASHLAAMRRCGAATCRTAEDAPVTPLASGR